MKYETIKTFILVVLVCSSLFLSFVLWSYQPNYDALSDPDYVNEVDVGGVEHTKAELVEPVDMIFHAEEGVYGFKRPTERRLFFKEIGSWIMYDQHVTESKGIPEDAPYVEIVFPDAIPAELISSLFTFNETINPPSWSFKRIFITLDNETNSLKFIIRSIDERMELTANIEKSERYYSVRNLLTENETLHEYVAFNEGRAPIYIPKEPNDMSEKTLVSTLTPPEDFINALFPHPSIVTHNIKEAYFTDGQGGIKTDRDEHSMEFISPLEPNYERLDPIDLFNNSINDINDHKGWTNDFQFDEMDRTKNSISYRLYYEGYPVYAGVGSSVIEQQWIANNLHQYARPLYRIGNSLSSHKVQLPSGNDVISFLSGSSNYDSEKISGIKIGYMVRHLNDARSLVLEPKWYVKYEGKWKQLNLTEELHKLSPAGETGGD